MQTLFEKKLYKNAGKATSWWLIEAQADKAAGTAQLKISFAKSADGAVTEKITPVKGMNIGKANETQPHEQAILEAESRAKKQLDKGYVENEADAAAPKTNALGLKMPMLAKAFDKVKPESIDWNTAYVQPKLDGHRCMAVDGVMYSRNGKEVKLPHLAAAIKEAGLEGLHLDGELYVHGTVLQDIGSLIKAPREESTVIQYWIYDIVSDLSFAERYALLANALGHQPFTLGKAAGPLILVPTIKVDSPDARKVLHERYVHDGYEGSMLRFGKKGYEDGKRSAGLLKGKDFDDGEWEVVGWEEGTPYRVMVDGEEKTFRVPVWILKTAKGQLFRATAAGTMQEKDALFQKADSVIGTKRTIRHFGFTPDGIPNLPVDLRARQDV